MIHTHQLTFSYDSKNTFVFPDIICDAGEGILITGTSGKGKTTLLHLLGGLLRPESGKISINQKDISILSAKETDRFRGQNIGMILQKSYFVESLSVLDNVVLASWLGQKKKNIEKARHLLKELDVYSKKENLPSELSIGQQQRVNIARALINEPKVLLADEPTSSLDDENAQIVSKLLQDLAIQNQAALIIVTHDQRLKSQFANQINL